MNAIIHVSQNQKDYNAAEVYVDIVGPKHPFISAFRGTLFTRLFFPSKCIAGACGYGVKLTLHGRHASINFPTLKQ